jgi:hypothetical protein
MQNTTTTTITATRILLGYCPNILSYSGDFTVGYVGPHGIDRLTAEFLFKGTPSGAMWDTVVILSELGGMDPDLGWHDELGLACQDWVTWGQLVDAFVDSW